MKETDFLKALGGIPQEYIDELNQWQQDKTPLSAAVDETPPGNEIPPQPAAPPEQNVPTPPGKEKIAMKKNEKPVISVRSFQPLTAAILAGLTACAVLAVFAGKKLASPPDITASVAEAPDTDTDHNRDNQNQTTQPAVSTESRPQTPYSINWCSYYGNLDIPGTSPGDEIVIRLHNGEEGAAYLRDDQSEDFRYYLTSWREDWEKSGLNPEWDGDSLLVGFPMLENVFSYGIRSVQVTDNILRINFAAYRNPNVPSLKQQTGAENLYSLIMTHCPDLPEFTGYQISYTIFDSDSDCTTGMDIAPDYLDDSDPSNPIDAAYLYTEQLSKHDPVYTAFDAARLGGKPPVLIAPLNCLYPKYTFVTQLDSALSEGVMVFENMAAAFQPELADVEYPELTNTLHGWACEYPEKQMFAIAVNTPTQDAACVIHSTVLHDDGILRFTLTQRLPETYADAEGTFVTAYMLDESLHAEGISFDTETLYEADDLYETNPENETFTAMMSASDLVPYIQLGEISFAASTTLPPEWVLPAETCETIVTTETDPPVTSAYEEPPMPTGEKCTEMREYIKEHFAELEIPDTIVLDPAGERLLFGNAFLRESLGLWIRPDAEQTAEIMVNQFLQMEFAESTQTPDEYTGGGFLLRIEEDDETTTIYEFFNSGFIIRTLYENGNVVSTSYLADTTGKAENLIRTLQNYQMSYDDILTRLVNTALDNCR